MYECWLHFISFRCLTSSFWMRTGPWTRGPGCGSPVPHSSRGSSVCSVLSSSERRPIRTGISSGKSRWGSGIFSQCKEAKKSGRKQLVIEIVSYMVVVEGMSTLVFGLGPRGHECLWAKTKSISFWITIKRMHIRLKIWNVLYLNFQALHSRA